VMTETTRRVTTRLATLLARYRPDIAGGTGRYLPAR
jgi:hypothetical protein